MLSRISNDDCDAYLLSESSLIVHDRRVTMLTCGRTTLVPAILELLGELREGQLEYLLYERRNENFPRLQPASFEDDVQALRKRVEGRVSWRR